MTPRPAWAPLFALLAAIILAACGGDDQQQQQQAPAAPETRQQEQARPEPAAPQEAGEEEPAASQAEQQAAPAEEEYEEPAEAEEPQISELAAAAGLGEYIVGGERPARLLVPGDWSSGEPLPLGVLLHDYSSDAETANQYFGGLHLQIEVARFALLLPNGQRGSDGETFWDAVPACCEYTDVDSDDVAYLASIVNEVRSLIDVNGVYLFGESNGGFMAYRMACEGAIPDLQAVVSVAGSSFETSDQCVNPSPVSVLQIHGTADQIIAYDGSEDLVNLANDDPNQDGHPGARELVERWAARASCDLERSQTVPAFDLDAAVNGNETTGLRFREGCVDNRTVDLWTMTGSAHSPEFYNLSAVLIAWITDIEQYRLTGISAVPPQPEFTEWQVGTAARPARLYAPAEYSRAESVPLVMLLHHYAGDADKANAYLGLRRQIETERFALLMPNGRTDEAGNRFWSATPACCDFNDHGEEDSTYLADLFTEARGYLDVNGAYIIGYDNGGFMAYRLACEGTIDDLRGISSISGSSFEDPAKCDNWRPVSVLQIHGSEDDAVLYAGNPGPIELPAGNGVVKQGVAETDNGHPDAVELTRRWAVRAGCNADAIEPLDNIDLDVGISGAETTRQRIRQGCGEHTIELWTIQGAGHAPSFRADIGATLIRWLKENWSYIGK